MLVYQKTYMLLKLIFRAKGLRQRPKFDIYFVQGCRLLKWIFCGCQVLVFRGPLSLFEFTNLGPKLHVLALAPICISSPGKQHLLFLSVTVKTVRALQCLLISISKYLTATTVSITVNFIFHDVTWYSLCLIQLE